MNSYNNLLKIYSKAIKLSERFKKTRLLVWTPLDILNELTLQISHLFTVLYDKYSESNRNITNMGDELSDVILQLIALSSSMNINLQKYNKEDIISSSNFDDLVVIYGQLVEAVMEINNKRFYNHLPSK